jgi:hypothetical protein
MPDPVCFRPHAAPVRSPIPQPRAVAALIAGLLLLLAPATALAEDAPNPEKLVALRLEWLTQLARQDAANSQAAQTEAIDISLHPENRKTVGNFNDPSVILKELRPVLAAEYGAIRRALDGLNDKARAKRDDAQKDWAEVVRQRAVFREYAEKQQYAYGFDYESGSPPGFQPTAIDGALLAWALVVIVIATRLRSQELRLDIRQAQRAAAACLLLGLVALPGCGGPPAGADTRPWAVREESKLNDDIADATAKAKSALDANKTHKKWVATLDGWEKLIAAETDKVDELVRTEETKLRDSLRDIEATAKLADRLAKDAEEQRGKLTEEKAKLDDMVAGAKWRTIAVTAMRVGAAALLFGFSIAPFWSARRTRRKRLRRAARTCPRCFRVNTLKVDPAGAAVPASKYRAAKRKKMDEDEELLEAEEEEEDDTPADEGEVTCTKCGLRIRKSYLTVPRLCFPTVGIRSSGKTHMLVTAYDRVRKRTAPTTAVVQPAPSGTDVDRRFSQLVDEIIHRRGEAGATDLVLPDPVLLHLKDTDPAGPNAALVNLFDYSGELINPEVDVNQLKDTAVRMDGFMLFLDPTQLAGDVTLDTQLENLDSFLNHMRRRRGVPVGKSIPVPVAVCITKFDLLITENPIGGQSVQYIRELLDNLNPPPRQMTMEVLRERSELVEQILPLMFPGADIRGVVEGYFGTQLLFFPISSVSLFEHELGVKDMTRRTMAPFGVAEPIMWLLHMHGYSVFG